jgi:hypothetical protein
MICKRVYSCVCSILFLNVPSLCACNKLCTLLLWFREPDFCFLRRFSVQIIGRQCNSRLVRRTGSQSSASASASSYALLIDSLLLMRRFALFILFRIRMSFGVSMTNFHCLIGACEIFSPLLYSNLSCWCKKNRFDAQLVT